MHMPMALYVLIAVALNAALTLLDGDCHFSDNPACISSGSTLLRTASKLCSVPVVPHGTQGKQRGFIRNLIAGYSYNNDSLNQKTNHEFILCYCSTAHLQPY
jgi:hypothetical protein